MAPLGGAAAYGGGGSVVRGDGHVVEVVPGEGVEAHVCFLGVRAAVPVRIDKTTAEVYVRCATVALVEVRMFRVNPVVSRVLHVVPGGPNVESIGVRFVPNNLLDGLAPPELLITRVAGPDVVDVIVLGGNDVVAPLRV